MPDKQLTARQSEVLAFIRARTRAGHSPSMREIAARFGIRLPNGVLNHIKALERRGALTRTAWGGGPRARAYVFTEETNA